jgi:hypothetical protein
MSRCHCKGCDGRGVRASALPSCQIDAARPPWIVVERCDTCERFTDDLAAALSLYRIAGWFPCISGSFHALANRRTKRKRQRGDSRGIGVSTPS